MSAITVLGVVATLVAAPPPPPTDSVSCSHALAWTLSRLQQDYAGFRDGVTRETRGAYEQLVGELRPAAARTHDVAGCLTILTQLTGFFHDGHLRVSVVASPPADTTPGGLRAHFKQWPAVHLTEAESRERLQREGDHRDPIEGVWQIVDADYRLGVVRSPGPRRDFAAFVLEADGAWWTAGQVKAEIRGAGPGAYHVMFYYRDHTARLTEARLTGRVLTLSGIGAWVETDPAGTGRDVAAFLAARNTRLAFERLDAQTAVIHLPTFSGSAALTIDRLLRANAAVIDSIPNLIVDVRGNGGGADRSYRGLMPLLYTGPITIVGVERFASPDNIAYRRRVAEDTTLAPSIRRGLRAEADSLQAHVGQMWVDPNAGGTLTFPTVRTNPRQVAVLMDRECASSCEQFLLAARQSRKVTLYGDRSAGVLDHANVAALPIPNAPFQLQYGTSRSRRLPDGAVDGIGIAPDVSIPPTVRDPVAWVRRHLAHGAHDGGRPRR